MKCDSCGSDDAVHSKAGVLCLKCRAKVDQIRSGVARAVAFGVRRVRDVALMIKQGVCQQPDEKLAGTYDHFYSNFLTDEEKGLADQVLRCAVMVDEFLFWKPTKCKRCGAGNVGWVKSERTGKFYLVTLHDAGTGSLEGVETLAARRTDLHQCQAGSLVQPLPAPPSEKKQEVRPQTQPVVPTVAKGWVPESGWQERVRQRYQEDRLSLKCGLPVRELEPEEAAERAYYEEQEKARKDRAMALLADMTE